MSKPSARRLNESAGFVVRDFRLKKNFILHTGQTFLVMAG